MPMNELRDCLAAAGFMNVITYISSGNVLFRSSLPQHDVEATLDTALKQTFDYDGPTIIVSEKEFMEVIDAAPADFGTQPGLLHSDVVFFTPDIKPFTIVHEVTLKEGVDIVAAGPRALYFTRLSAKRSSSRMGRIIDLPWYKKSTIRSWNTVHRLAELLKSPAE